MVAANKPSAAAMKAGIAAISATTPPATRVGVKYGHAPTNTPAINISHAQGPGPRMLEERNAAPAQESAKIAEDITAVVMNR